MGQAYPTRVLVPSVSKQFFWVADGVVRHFLFVSGVARKVDMVAQWSKKQENPAEKEFTSNEAVAGCHAHFG